MRLVIVSGSLSAPLKHLQRLLERHKTDRPGPPTKNESDAFDHLVEMMGVLTERQRELVLRCGVICELAVEELHDTGSREAVGFLGHVVIFRRRLHRFQ